MSVLTYGMPTVNKLLCDNPVCQEYATFIAHLEGKDVCCCTEHLGQLTDNQSLKRLERLVVAGERNHSDEESKKETAS